MPNYKHVSFGYTRHIFCRSQDIAKHTKTGRMFVRHTVSYNFNVLYLRHCPRKNGKAGPVVNVGYRRTFCRIMMDIWSAAEAQSRQRYGKIDCWMCFLAVTNSDLFFFPSSLF